MAGVNEKVLSFQQSEDVPLPAYTVSDEQEATVNPILLPSQQGVLPPFWLPSEVSPALVFGSWNKTCLTIV